MTAIADRPSATELEELTSILAAANLDRGALSACLRRIEDGLRAHARELDETGGLLDESDKAQRMSLAREDERLRKEINALIAEVDGLRQATNRLGDDEALKRKGAAVLAGLRGHRDAEASLVLENADTEVGSGD